MPQIGNEEIIRGVLGTILEVIKRRTSEAYAIMAVNSAIKNISGKYSYLNHIEIKSLSLSESVGKADIKIDTTFIKREEIGGSISDLIKKISDSMGRDIGYYFIREIKEEMPPDFQELLIELNVHLDFLQMEYIVNVKRINRHHIENSEALKHVFNAIFDILERENGRRRTISTLRELIGRFSTEYDVFRYVEINDVTSIQNIETISVKIDVDEIDSNKVGEAIQKIIHETNKVLKERGGYFFIEKFKNKLNEDYLFRIKDMGVDFNAIALEQDVIVKNVMESLIDILGEGSSQKYAIFALKEIIKKNQVKYECLNYIQLDLENNSEEADLVIVDKKIDSIRPSELGRSIQKILENLIKVLGEKVGPQFIDKLKDKIGKAHVLKLEEMGVNLHMVQLRQSMIW